MNFFYTHALLYLCALAGVGSVFAQDSSMVKKSTPTLSLSERDIVISSEFKPSVRGSSKILFKPNAFQPIDTPSMDAYTYSKLRFSPAAISFLNNSATTNEVGIMKLSRQRSKVQYISLGYGLHQQLQANTHLAWIRREKGDVHAFLNYNQLVPDNELYRRNYDVDAGLMGRIFLKNRWQLELHYFFSTSSVRSAYHKEDASPSTITIPHTYHEVRLGSNNDYAPFNNKVYIAPLLRYTRCDNTVDGLGKQFKEDGILARIPASISLKNNLHINAEIGYDWYRNKVENNAATAADLTRRNTIFRASTNLQLNNSKLNAYLGFSTYVSSKYGFQIYPDAFLRYSFGKAGLFFVQLRFNTQQYYQTLRSFHEKNAWIVDDNALGNVVHISSQGSFQYNKKDRFNARISLTWNQFRNIRLITNNYENGYALFRTLQEESINEIVLTNDYMYINPNQYEVGLKLSRTFIASMSTNDKPYGRYYPFVELYGVYHLLPKLRLRASFVSYDKVFYLDENNITRETTPTYNLSLHIAYYLMNNKLHIWTTLDNIINQQYERWNLYRHPGFIATLGVSFYLK